MKMDLTEKSAVPAMAKSMPERSWLAVVCGGAVVATGAVGVVGVVIWIPCWEGAGIQSLAVGVGSRSLVQFIV